MAQAADEASSLDTLLCKYGSSNRSIQLRESGKSSTDDHEGGNRDEPSSQFLKEIRERAQILSRNAAKTRKAALQNVVNDDSHVTSSASGGTSVDLFMDVIRNADISDEIATKSPAPPDNDEDLTAYSTDDLLQSVIPLDSAPWTTEDEDTLNTSHDYYRGLPMEPWGTSTTEPCDDDNDSNDSDSTSQESLDSDNDSIDGGDNSVCTSRKDVGQLKPDADICKESDLTSCVQRVTKENTQNYVDAIDDTSLDQHFRFQPPSQEQGFEDIGMKGYQGMTTVASDEDGDSDDDEKHNKESCLNKDASDRSPDSNLLSSIPVETFDGDLMSGDQYSLKLQVVDAGAFEDSELGDKTYNDADPAVLRELHPYGVQRGIHKEDGSIDDNSLGMRQGIQEETTEVEVREKREAIWEHQPASQVHDISFSLSGNDVAEDYNLEMSTSVTEEKDDIHDNKSSRYFEASSPVKDTSASILNDFDIVINRSDVNEAEENGAASSQHFRPTSQTRDTSIPSLGHMLDESDFQIYAKNQMGSEIKTENQSSSHHVPLSGSEQVTAVQERISSALLDEMLGQDVGEERSLEENKDDDLMLMETQELSRIQKSLDESSARGTMPSQQFTGNDGEDAKGMISYDTGSTVEEKCSETRQESAESVDYFSSLLRIQDDEILADETNLIVPSHSPGELLDDEDIRAKEKTVQQNLDSLMEIKSKGDQTSESIGAPPCHSQDASSTSEKQAVNSEPIHPYAKSHLTTFNSQKKQLISTETTGYSDKSIFPKQTRTCQRQERRWNSDRTTDSKSSRHVGHEAEDSKDTASTSKISPRQGQWSTKKDLALTQDSSSEQTDKSFSDEEPKGPSNVRSLIARFNSGRANASPVESPRSDRSFEWNVSSPDGKHKMREKLPSMGSSCPDHKTSPPQQYQARSTDEGTSDPQNVPWMQELRERKKRRERRSEWGKLPH